jgi:phospholipid/cholesterol/gamma-HCH transport system substrate-binding protein
MKIRGPLIKLVAFAFATIFVTLVLAKTIGNFDTGPKSRYAAEFTAITGLLPGDDIRIAGVTVGRVATTKVATCQGDRGPVPCALVTFTVDKDIELRRSTRAAVRFRDLLGRRYIALSEATGDPQVIAPNETDHPIELKKTTPALDLTLLFNGFRPLFQALSPKQVNTLATEIVRTLQGEGPTVDALLANTASLTNTLADRDQVIGRVIENLNDLVQTVATRDDKLGELIVSLQELSTGLAGDRDAIGGALQGIDSFATTIAGFLDDARPSLDRDLRDLKLTTDTIVANKARLDRVLKRLPGGLEALTRATSYGSWLNLYVCNFAVQTSDGQTFPIDGNGQQQAVCR